MLTYAADSGPKFRFQTSQALDRIMIGFNGVKRAKTSLNRAEKPATYDVNKALVTENPRRRADHHVMGSKTAEDGTTTAEPVSM